MKSMRKFCYELSTPSRMAPAIAALLAIAILAGCDVERRKSDAELGLSPQQAAGRKIYDDHCDRCHRPYSTKGRKGPGLKGVFQHQYLPLSGLPANDERVTDIIRNGRPDMPGLSQVLSAQDIQDLLAYLHTL
jgi:mono/diheme cytochrome c family protein